MHCIDSKAYHVVLAWHTVVSVDSMSPHQGTHTQAPQQRNTNSMAWWHYGLLALRGGHLLCVAQC